MTCENIKLTFYLIKSGEASTEEKVSFSKPLRYVPCLQKTFIRNRKNSRFVQQQKNDNLPPAHIKSYIIEKAANNSHKPEKNKFLRIACPLAAAAVVIITLGILFHNSTAQLKRPVKTNNISPEAITIEADQSLELLLSEADSDISSVNNLLAELNSPTAKKSDNISTIDSQINEDAIDVINDFQKELLSISPYSDS